MKLIFKVFPQDMVQRRFLEQNMDVELFKVYAEVEDLLEVFKTLSQDRVQQRLGEVFKALSPDRIQQRFAVLTLVSSRTRGYGVLNVIPIGGERSWMTAVSASGTCSRASDNGSRQWRDQTLRRSRRRRTLRSSPHASKAISAPGVTVPPSSVVLTAGGATHVRSRTRTTSSGDGGWLWTSP